MRVARRHPLVRFGDPVAASHDRLKAVVAAICGCALRHLQKQARERRIRADEQALEQLPDRILKDIGLGRSEIPYASRSSDFERQRRLLRRRHTVTGPAGASSGQGNEPPAGPGTGPGEERCP